MTPIKPRESVLTFLGMWYHLYFLSLQWLLVGLKWCICKTLLIKTVLLQKRVLGENGLQVIKKYLIQEE